MKIVCTQENLKNGLNRATRIISSSNTLPILNNLLLKTENGLLKISSTNLEISISTYVRCKIEESGEICVPAKTLTDLVNSLTTENITLQNDKVGLLVQSERSKSVLKILSSEDFPSIPQVENKTNFSLGGLELRQALAQVIFAASSNETQPEICGVYMCAKGGSCKIVATDRYRLAEKTVTINSSLEFAVILPLKTSQELLKALASYELMVDIIVSENQILFVLGDTHITSRLVDGQYPEYAAIIPEAFVSVVSTDREALMAALKTSGVFSQGTNSVSLAYEEDGSNLVVSSGNQEVGESTVLVPSKVSGPGGSIVFNYRYIQDVLGVMREPSVNMNVNNDTTAVIFREASNKEYMYLVMPIKN